jgi:hypothetical protein
MEWKDVQKLIADLAPSVGTAIGSIVPGGAIIGGLAGKILQNAFGTSSPDKLTEVISADPEAAMKLRQAEIQFQLEQSRIYLEETKSFLADVQSARSREVEMAKATGKPDLTLSILAWTIISGFFSLTGALLYVSYLGKTIADQTGVLYMLLGTLSTAFGMVVGYYFGSSKGSAAKDVLLANGRK